MGPRATDTLTFGPHAYIQIRVQVRTHEQHTQCHNGEGSTPITNSRGNQTAAADWAAEQMAASGQLPPMPLALAAETPLAEPYLDPGLDERRVTEGAKHDAAQATQAWENHRCILEMRVHTHNASTRYR